jgi:hypothetical protein
MVLLLVLFQFTEFELWNHDLYQFLNPIPQLEFVLAFGCQLVPVLRLVFTDTAIVVPEISAKRSPIVQKVMILFVIESLYCNMAASGFTAALAALAGCLTS